MNRSDKLSGQAERLNTALSSCPSEATCHSCPSKQQKTQLQHNINHRPQSTRIQQTNEQTNKQTNQQTNKFRRSISLLSACQTTQDPTQPVQTINSNASLEKAKVWIRELQKQADAQIVIALAGNKADLEERRQVPTEEAQRFAEEENLLFFETSAKDSTNVTDIFTAIAPPMAIITLGTTSTYLGLVLELKTQTCMNYSPNMVE
ncbi:GTP-binding protein of the rab/ypt [Puccinia graminis f. sp. tritici]|uniref:GTP-binding protein of the rab/ypt n=1 Tax=Puccinia graminis f. sp. tritici TaxID=56615 RepID=A0A5B0M0I7_PUCGR|nr:GTP-binding protein of the rab/ypt [Puccinia graminis f. sp. tritici]